MTLRPGLIGWLILLSVLSPVAQGLSNLDIDYSHNIQGSGTLMTDYQMKNPQNSAAAGGVRGTGEMMDRYLFSTNRSSQFLVEDKFVLEELPHLSQATKTNKYPRWPVNPTIRFIGTDWAGNVPLPQLKDISPDIPMIPSTKSSESKTTSQIDSYRSMINKGSFEFGGISNEMDKTAFAGTRVVDSSGLDADAALAIGNSSFNYRSMWFNSTNVSVRSVIGEAGKILYEEDAQVDGNSTGRKKLMIID